MTKLTQSHLDAMARGEHPFGYVVPTAAYNRFKSFVTEMGFDDDDVAIFSDKVPLTPEQIQNKSVIYITKDKTYQINDKFSVVVKGDD